MADTLLKVDNINVYYGNIHAVKDISFEVDQGEIVTLIGANGAGKSTTLKTISGLLKPKTGDILYKGSSIKGMRAHKIVEAGLAHVPEGRHVQTASWMLTMARRSRWAFVPRISTTSLSLWQSTQTVSWMLRWTSPK